MRGSDKGVFTFDLHITGKPIGLDITYLVRSIEVADINNLNTAVSICHQRQIIFTVDTVDIRVRQIQAPGQQVRNTKLAITILDGKQE
tara:strand:- start:43099 stop:43362 length:264 start_codon:yes stop_codon:yes gene_type:complete